MVLGLKCYQCSTDAVDEVDRCMGQVPEGLEPMQCPDRYGFCQVLLIWVWSSLSITTNDRQRQPIRNKA